MRRTLSISMIVLLVGVSVAAIVRAQTPQQPIPASLSAQSERAQTSGTTPRRSSTLAERLQNARTNNVGDSSQANLSEFVPSGATIARSDETGDVSPSALNPNRQTTTPVAEPPYETYQNNSAASTNEPRVSSRREFGTAPGPNTPTQIGGTTDSSAVSTRDGIRAENLMDGASPNLQLTTTGPGTVIVGREASYVVILSNTGTSVADEVAVELRIPAGAELVSATGSDGTTRFEGEQDQEGLIRWDIGRIGSHGKSSLTVTLIPRSPRAFDLAVAWAALPSTATSHIEVLEPKLNVLLAGPTDVLFGDSSIYTVTVTNPGTGVTENIVLSLPATGSADGAVRTQVIGALQAGGRKTIEFEVTPQEEGIFPVHVTAVAEGNLNAEESRDVLVRRANFQIAMEGPRAKFAGTSASYRIQVVNTGNANAMNVTAVADLPEGATFIACEGGGEYNEERGQVEWLIGSLRPNENRELALTCLLANAGENRVGFDATSGGGLAASESVLTKVEALADLKLELFDPRGPIEVGEDALYEIRITNRGTKAAENILVFAYFENGVNPIAVQGGVAEIDLDGGVVFRPIPQIEAGQEITLQITARASHSGDLKFRAEAECSDPNTRLVGEETTRYYGGAAPTGEDSPVSSAPSTENPSVPR